VRRRVAWTPIGVSGISYFDYWEFILGVRCYQVDDKVAFSTK
jgi:hypothetical protein